MLQSGLVTVASQLPAQAGPRYVRRELTIPMRDQTTLVAVALVPVGITTPLPILLVRTAFNASRHLADTRVPLAYRELATDGYIFVAEDIRGRNRSGGTFVTNRAQDDPRNAPGTNESTDAFDTIDWLVKNVPSNNGRVGVIGTSYSGWLAGLAIPDFDQYTFYHRIPTLDSLAKVTGVSALPSWIGFRAHPTWDAYWQAKAMQRVLTTSTVPTRFVGGFWDEEDMLGAQLAYRTLERSDSRDLNRIVLGPRAHNGWTRASGDVLGPVPLGSKTADDFREKIQRPWFAYYLHGTGDGQFPEAWMFESGGNTWRSFDAWPPRTSQRRNIYLREQGVISFEPPPATQKSDFDAFISDPEHPVPYMPRPDDGSAWSTWRQQDQRFVDGRPDVLTWLSEPLTSDFTIACDVVAHLFASTTGSNADGVVKLIDVAPDRVPDGLITGGYHLIVNADIMRGRYWQGFSSAQAIPANVVTPFNVDLHDQLYRFKRGHRLMVQIQSTWFPLYDRNPQRFVPNILMPRPPTSARSSTACGTPRRTHHTL